MNLAINYFLTQIPSVASDNCIAYFDFESGQNNPTLLYNKSGNNTLTGVLNNFNPDFWSKYSNGLFKNNTYVSLSGLGNIIDRKDFTLSFIYENKNSKGSTLISTVETGSFISYDIFGNPQTNLIYKGFNFGVTANNYLFFEYYSSNGPNIFIGDESLSDKNSIFLSITENNLAFGYYDFFKNKLISNNHYISTDYLLDYNDLYIGFNPRTNTGIYNFNRNFTGYIDELLIFSPSIYAYDLVNLNSGFVHTYESGTYYSYVNSVTGITGYLTGITGYTTGITGTTIVQTGTAVDEFGIEYNLYYESGISGIIELYDITPITGVIESEIVSGYSGQGIFLNTQAVSSFGKNKINILSNIRSGDILDVNLITTLDKPYFYKNLNLNYQKYLNNFILPDLTIALNEPIVYVNGQLQHSGSFYQTGNIYNISQYIINDYYLNEVENFLFANNYNESDSVFIDMVTGYNQNLLIENFRITGGSGILALTGWNGLENNIYFNGQKLINGIHYKTLYSEEYQTLTGQNYNDLFGTISTFNYDGSVLFIGAPYSDSNRGKVYIYKNTGDGFKVTQTVNGKNIINDNFGRTAISCDYSGRLFATDSYANTNGEVHIYRTNDFQTWSLIQTLSGDYPTNYIGDAFGYRNVSFSNDGKTLLIGSAYADNNSGALWIYTGDINNKWILTQKISGYKNSRPSPGVWPDLYFSAFPTTSCINKNGTILFASAETDTENDSDYAGAVLIYTGNSGKFGFLQKIKGDPSGLSYGDLFGRDTSCSDDGNTLAVGSLHDNFGTSYDGALYIFTRNKDGYFKLLQKNLGDLTKGERKDDRLGYHVKMNGDGSIIQCSSQHDQPSPSNYGAAWFFQKNGNSYPLIDKKTGSYSNMQFGHPNNSISLDGNFSLFNTNPGTYPRFVKIYKNNFESGTVKFENKNVLYSGSYGKLLGIPKSTDFYNYIAETNLYENSIQYFNGFSEIYKNGIRQTLNSDYLELANIDTNTGIGFFDQKSDIIYNNEDLFNL